ncbi:BTAD domain-containing putative transcriptional regulator, partial [Mesorhizobium sp. 10.2.3]
MPVLSVRLLGPLVISRNDVPVALPSSRKLRALFAYLALAPRAVGRSRLCELLWDVPNDPRAELRWCLSKLRGALDAPGRGRVSTQGDTVALDLSDCLVDALEVSRAAAQGIGTLDVERLRALAKLFAGDFLDGLEVERSPHFNSWLIAQRRRFSACHAAVLEQLVESLPADGDEAIAYLDTWVELAPLDGRAHAALLAGLARRGEIGAAEAHLAAAERLFRSEELDFAPLRAAWQAIRDQWSGASLRTQPACLSTLSPLVATTPTAPGPVEPSHASLAVMPFVEESGGTRGGLADGFTHDIITRLAKLRDFFVIARGSVFALAEQNIAPEDAGRRLNVDYVATGTVRSPPGRLIVSVELIEVRTARIVWAETFERRPDDIFAVLDDIGNSIVSSISAEI